LVRLTGLPSDLTPSSTDLVWHPITEKQQDASKGQQEASDIKRSNHPVQLYRAQPLAGAVISFSS
jgi:hypothetical protein